MGMVGGGPDAFIGAVHRHAAFLDGQIELVCGVFSTDPAKSKIVGKSLFIHPDRIYDTYREMFERECLLSETERMDFVSIVTPNHVHYEPAKLAIEHGFHVVLDKPMTLTLKEAKELKRMIDKSGIVFCLTYTYTGYPMIKQARQMIKEGLIGEIRKIYMEYPQGWLSLPAERTGNKQAIWRTDPSKSGIAGCMGDIGTHAANMIEYVSGLKITKLCADINIIVEDRVLDDDGVVLLKFESGASGVLMSSQIATGEENNIKIRVYGEKAGLEWKQDDANTLLVKWRDKPIEVFRTGGLGVSEVSKMNTRTPAGHPEGYLEAFANLYKNFVSCVRAHIDGTKLSSPYLSDFPGSEEGVRGMLFIEKVIESGKSDKKWIAMK